MKKPNVYFNEARPFNSTVDACLLDALEQMLAVVADCELFGIGVTLTVLRDESGIPVIEIEGGDNCARGRTIRTALQNFFNETTDADDVPLAARVSEGAEHG